MNVALKSSEQAMAVVKRMVFLAYAACGGPVGMGVFQDMRLGGKNPDEERIWKCAFNSEDYAMKHTADNEVYCDYVFGRMMKWGCKWNGNVITIRNCKFSLDYNAFCHTYPNDQTLVAAAIESLGIKDAVIEQEGTHV